MCNEVLWADGRKSWVKEVNLPQKIKDCLQKGEPYVQKVIPLEEFEQRRSEYQLQGTTIGLSLDLTQEVTTAVKRYVTKFSECSQFEYLYIM